MIAPGAQQGAGLGDRLVVQMHVDVLRGQQGGGRTTRGEGLQRLTAEDAAADLLEQHAERGTHGQLVVAWPLNLAADREHLRAGRLLGALLPEPVGAARHDVRHVHQRLDVVDHGRRGVETLHRRERRPEPRLTPQSLERVEQGGLLTADVCPSAAMQHDVEVVVATHDPGAQIAACVGLVDGALQHQ